MKQKIKALAIGAALAIAAGCGTSTTIVLTDSTGVHVGTFEVADTPIPAVSYSTGPRFAAMTRKGSINGLYVDGSASITNETHALGIYDSYEVKNLRVKAIADTADGATNATVRAKLEPERAELDAK